MKKRMFRELYNKVENKEELNIVKEKTKEEKPKKTTKKAGK